ncbi:MAG: hypothetical protein A2V88_01680 [Elusimicrobia bacterium RBG_16_66_12]|nr:MAG: hypothetical protein A2V88_01680 [Elusimicrobia bacterium RBG_16_66_12]
MSSDDVLRRHQRAFIESCSQRFLSKAQSSGLKSFEVQAYCARGVGGEEKLAALAKAAQHPQEDGSAGVNPSPRLGAGGKSLVVTAVGVARKQWQPDACLANLLADFQYDDMGREKYVKWDFEFYSPSTDSRNFTVNFNNFSGNTPNTARTGNAPPVCITKMGIDSDEAIAIGMKNGLTSGLAVAVFLELMMVTDARIGHRWDAVIFEKFQKLRGKTIWRINTKEKHVLIDADTGEILGRIE